MRRRLIALMIGVCILLSGSVPAQAAAQVTILFHFQGGDNGTAEVQLLSQETTLPAIKVPDRRGYSFVGYYTAAAGKGTQYYGSDGKPTVSVSPAGNLMLYAAWKVQSYAIAYENMEGATATTALPSSHTYGTTTTIPNPTKPDYTFFGWQVDQSPVSQKSLTLGCYDFSAPVTLTAVWNKALLVTANDNTTTTVKVSDADLRRIFDTQVSEPAKGVTAFDLNSEEVTLIMTSSDADDQAEGAAQVIAMAQGDVMKLYDFSVHKKVLKQNEPSVTTNLNELPTTVQVDINLIDTLAGKTGYRVYRYHDGQAQTIPTGPIADATGQAEYFEVSPDGAVLTIHTRRLSTYAVVANTKTVATEDGGSAMDVQAKMVVSSFGPEYRVEFQWGAMRFYYSKDAIWNPETHAYDEESKFEWQERLSYENGNNLVRVLNHSNADVMVSMLITNQQLPGVDIGIYKTNTANGVAAEGMRLSRVPAENAPAPAVDGYVRLTGAPDNWETMEGQPETNGFTKIASIAVTISYCNSPLTPQS